jgi:hypothetical protein
MFESREKNPELFITTFRSEILSLKQIEEPTINDLSESILL